MFADSILGMLGLFGYQSKAEAKIQNLIQTQEQLIQDVNQLYPECNYSYLARSNS
jgi:hypothetical protein